MLMTANAAIAQLVDPEIYIPLAFSGTNCGFDCGEAGITGIGLDPNGSDGYDDNLDIPAFPGAPSGDGRVIFNSDVIPIGLTRDVRQLGADNITWTLSIDNGLPAQDITATWFTAMVPANSKPVGPDPRRHCGGRYGSGHSLAIRRAISAHSQSRCGW
jgi:hypothetical protein